jgi:hypothetical protein
MPILRYQYRPPNKGHYVTAFIKLGVYGAVGAVAIIMATRENAVHANLWGAWGAHSIFMFIDALQVALGEAPPRDSFFWDYLIAIQAPASQYFLLFDVGVLIWFLVEVFKVIF